MSILKSLCITLIFLASFYPNQDDIASKESRCFYNRDLALILILEGSGDFLFVNNEILMGTEYLLVEKGYFLDDGKGVTLMVTAIANFEADSINMSSIENLVDPLIIHGNLTKKGIWLKPKAAFLKRCSCSKKALRIVDLRGFYPEKKQ